MYHDESWSLGKSVMGVGRAIEKDMRCAASNVKKFYLLS
jgi:hypothetical protein